MQSDRSGQDDIGERKEQDMKLDKLIFATGNEGKMKEIRMILADLPTEVLSMKEAGIQADIVEDGTTFEENALIKARKVAEISGCAAMADDSGLEVDYLDKAPGIYSARFLGEDTSYRIKNQYIIDKLDGVEGDARSARFVCAIALALPDGRTFTTRATIEGVVAKEERGEGGFGYDPIMYIPEYGKTTAELSPEEKNEISHRGKALRQMKELMNSEKEG